MVRRALTRQTRWYQNRCSTLKIKDFIVQKPFWKILECWPLVTSILTWAKNDRNDFEMIFRELSNAVFRFVLRCAGAEIDGRCSNTPPPAGGGKSRGPLGRGLTRHRLGCFCRPEAALLGALRIRRLRFKAVLGLVSLNWGQNGTWCRKWRFATNVAHYDKYGAVISGVLTYITLPSFVRIGQHLSKLWPSEVFDAFWHVPRGRRRHLMGTSWWPVDVIITMWNMIHDDATVGDLWPAKDAKCVKYRIFT